jgi:hypothetical protein
MNVLVMEIHTDKPLIKSLLCVCMLCLVKNNPLLNITMDKDHTKDDMRRKENFILI